MQHPDITYAPDVGAGGEVHIRFTGLSLQERYERLAVALHWFAGRIAAIDPALRCGPDWFDVLILRPEAP